MQERWMREKRGREVGRKKNGWIDRWIEGWMAS